jgi:hypothetical protein
MITITITRHTDFYFFFYFFIFFYGGCMTIFNLLPVQLSLSVCSSFVLIIIFFFSFPRSSSSFQVVFPAPDIQNGKE